MTTPKNILVTTTSSIDGLHVRQYLKPISAHIVAGTNLFSDFLASFSDVFGGRSQTYQKQLVSLYNEAIERLQLAAYEIGANCIIGLKVDLDEISGKGKSMFMLTAIGTAVVIEEFPNKKPLADTDKKFENIGIDRIKILQQKRHIIEEANEESLTLDDDIWNFITSNQVHEVYDFILVKLEKAAAAEVSPDFYKKVLIYIDSLPEEKRLELLYDSILEEEDEKLVLKLCEIIEDLQLLDLNRVTTILHDEQFDKQKRGLKILTYDKPFYNKGDLEKIRSFVSLIKEKFTEKGTRSMKKQLLSSKEKEVWICECGKTNDIGSYCGNCNKDIYGFKSTEVNPLAVIYELEEKISLIEEYIKE